ncbi:hypothetical protein BDN72DRAFT_840360 [Pluteus cervinus]|uniref:Uncharacterized protein n=1 Tax=Pluteus cervinus TaxID=181527 RepID=A0ACD3AUN7_9AGAR|nr:hypothetical protein BDN72DRAFT_840360 [Pluteus cervinus]
MDIPEIKQFLREELQNPVDAGLDFAQNAFSYLEAEHWSELSKSFLSSGLYANGRWTAIPAESPRYEKSLYAPLVALINGVIAHFQLPDRQVQDTSGVYLTHVRNRMPTLLQIWGKAEDELTLGEIKDIAKFEELSQANKTAPDITIFAKGGHCFQSLDFPDHTKRNYASVLCPLEVKLGSNTNHEKHLLQVAIYARECFTVQHNRRHVYSAILTEKHITLYQFNRAIAVRSSRIDYHEFPELFVKLLLGLLAADDAELELAFDTSIFWADCHIRGRIRKIRVEFDGLLRELDLVSFQPRWNCDTIIGRSTTCWEIEIDGQQIVAKDVWCSKVREKESEFLERVEDLPGLCQMFSYKENGAVFENKWLSGVPLQNDRRNRVLCRLLMKKYGESLEHFSSLIGLLEAFYDAICAHRGLWWLGILHRDVSLNNILFGTNPNDVGNRGILIDLDLAIFLSRITSGAGHDFLTGTRVFLSFKILMNSEYPHDFLDDLESFFYVLLWILLSRGATGERVDCIPDLLNEWRNDDPKICAGAKSRMLNHFDIEVFPVLQHGKFIRRLLLQLATFVHKHNVQDRKQMKPMKKDIPLDKLHPEGYINAMYDEFLGYVNEAIQSLKANNEVDGPVSDGESDDDDNLPSSPCRPSLPSGRASDLSLLKPSTSSSHNSQPLGSTLGTKRSVSSREPEAIDTPDSPSKRLKMLSGEPAPRAPSDSDDDHEEAPAATSN